MGKVVQVNVTVSPQALMSQCVEQIVSTVRTKVAELRAQAPQRPVVLIGWLVGAAVACTVSLVEEIAAVVCLGFPCTGVEGSRGDCDDPILELKTPLFVAIGQHATMCHIEELETLRYQMAAPSAAVVVGAGDNELRVNHYLKKRKSVTQTLVDKAILDEVYKFLSTALTDPLGLYVPVSNTVPIPMFQSVLTDPSNPSERPHKPVRVNNRNLSSPVKRGFSHALGLTSGGPGSYINPAVTSKSQHQAQTLLAGMKKSSSQLSAFHGYTLPPVGYNKRKVEPTTPTILKKHKADGGLISPQSAKSESNSELHVQTSLAANTGVPLSSVVTPGGSTHTSLVTSPNCTVQSDTPSNSRGVGVTQRDKAFASTPHQNSTGCPSSEHSDQKPVVGGNNSDDTPPTTHPTQRPTLQPTHRPTLQQTRPPSTTDPPAIQSRVCRSAPIPYHLLTGPPTPFTNRPIYQPAFPSPAISQYRNYQYQSGLPALGPSLDTQRPLPSVPQGGVIFPPSGPVVYHQYPSTAPYATCRPTNIMPRSLSDGGIPHDGRGDIISPFTPNHQQQPIISTQFNNTTMATYSAHSVPQLNTFMEWRHRGFVKSELQHVNHNNPLYCNTGQHNSMPSSPYLIGSVSAMPSPNNQSHSFYQDVPPGYLGYSSLQQVHNLTATPLNMPRRVPSPNTPGYQGCHNAPQLYRLVGMSGGQQILPNPPPPTANSPTCTVAVISTTISAIPTAVSSIPTDTRTELHCHLESTALCTTGSNHLTSKPAYPCPSIADKSIFASVGRLAKSENECELSRIERVCNRGKHSGVSEENEAEKTIESDMGVEDSDNINRGVVTQGDGSSLRDSSAVAAVDRDDEVSSKSSLEFLGFIDDVTPPADTPPANVVLAQESDTLTVTHPSTDLTTPPAVSCSDGNGLVSRELPSKKKLIAQEKETFTESSVECKTGNKEECKQLEDEKNLPIGDKSSYFRDKDSLMGDMTSLKRDASGNRRRSKRFKDTDGNSSGSDRLSSRSKDSDGNDSGSEPPSSRSKVCGINPRTSLRLGRSRRSSSDSLSSNY